VTIAESLVALTIFSVAAALGVALLIGTERRVREDAISDAGAQTVREVVAALAGDVEFGLGDSLRVHGDTALDLYSPIGHGVICAADSVSAALAPAARRDGVPFATWWVPLAAGDVVVASDSAVPTPRGAVVASAAERAVGTQCRTATGFLSPADSSAAVPATTFATAGSFARTLRVGSAVRFYRPVRWVVYRAADRRYWLGQRRCTAALNCGVVQPVAGPVAPPADSGLRFTADGRGGVRVWLRADGVATRPVHDYRLRVRTVATP